MMMPAAEAASFAGHAAGKALPRRAAERDRLRFRRTMIPILLTCGVLLLGIGSLPWIAGADSVFADRSVVLSAMLCGAGVCLLLVAALNMLQVRAESLRVPTTDPTTR